MKLPGKVFQEKKKTINGFKVIKEIDPLHIIATKFPGQWSRGMLLRNVVRYLEKSFDKAGAILFWRSQNRSNIPGTRNVASFHVPSDRATYPMNNSASKFCKV